MGPAMPGPIPWTAMAVWAEYHNYNQAEMALLDHCFKAMDMVYLQHFQRKAETQLKK